MNPHPRRSTRLTPGIAYVDGRYVPVSRAGVSIEDRGYQFADGVYEGIALRRGRLVDLEAHLDRLDRSLAELAIPAPMARGPLRQVLQQVVRRNRHRDGFVYVQVTRTAASRDHKYPDDLRPVLVVTVKRLNFDAVAARARKGVAAVTAPDQRWARCDIKSISLLPNVMAKQQAAEAGAFEAVMVDAGGTISEGSSTNIWLVDAGGTLRTRPLSANILCGITRQVVLKLADQAGLPVVEDGFTPAEARAGRELFLTSTTSAVTPIVSLDGTPIAAGRPGPVALDLLARYMDHMDTS
ncbi:D-amino-acid transaminase [Yunchengibacter salinarum]|uniref:D-amino-acid transaminase n=1 Tax=Yunchengibacter salinarum TaxID=3133399 RepID=UPI0035B6514F